MSVTTRATGMRTRMSVAFLSNPTRIKPLIILGPGDWQWVRECMQVGLLTGRVINTPS